MKPFPGDELVVRAAPGQAGRALHVVEVGLDGFGVGGSDLGAGICAAHRPRQGD